MPCLTDIAVPCKTTCRPALPFYSIINILLFVLVPLQALHPAETAGDAGLQKRN